MIENDDWSEIEKVSAETEGANRTEEPAGVYGDHYTYGDYLKFEYDYMVELIRGKIFKMSPAPSDTHQRVSVNMSSLIWHYLKGKICEIRAAPFDVVLPVQNRNRKQSANTVVQPDICVICDLAKMDAAGCFGAPDWVIEIVSPHTSIKDKQLKYEVYEEAGVKEYWIIMLLEKVIEIFVLKNGKYEHIRTCKADDKVSSTVLPDLSIDLKEVFDY